jgi:uncharacterized membrane protein
MTEDKRKLQDERMEAIMGRLLQIGVLLASAFVLVGGVLYVHANSSRYPDYKTFAGEPFTLKNPTAILEGLLAGSGSAIIQVGLLLLIATPVARVVFAIVAFGVERDLLYVAISLTVLGVLLAGLLHLT